MVDALVTLEAFYGSVDLAVQRRLVRRLLPRADLAVYLDVDADVAVSRKPGDAFGRHVVERQLAASREELATAPFLARDADRPAPALALDVLRRLCER